LEDATWEAADAETKTVIEAYTRGVNAWLDDLENDRNDAKLSEEYTFPLLQNADIEPWEPRDTLAHMLGLMEYLSNSTNLELSLGRAYGHLEPEVAFDVLGLLSATQSSTIESSGETYPNQYRLPFSAETLRASHERLHPIAPLLEEAEQVMDRVRSVRGATMGSNSWAVGPSRTASGKAMLINDPHLGMANPMIWYVVRLSSKKAGGDLDIAGFSYPGLFGIIIGHNDNVAWSATTSGYDLTDVYVETLNADRTAVVFNGNEVPIVEHEFVFNVSGADRTETFRYVPHHGPIISMDAEAGTAITVRWTGHDGHTDVNALLPLMKATNVDGARQALLNSTTTGQNWVVMDTNDDIAWYPYSAVPGRPWASMETPPWLPLPGDGSAEWGDPIPYDQLPQLVNPSAGVISTANQDLTGTFADGDPTNAHAYLQGAGVAWGYRHQRIVDLLEAGGNAHDFDSMLEMLGDTHMLIAQDILPQILGVAANSTLGDSAQRLFDALESWQYTCPTGLAGHEPDSPKAADPTETRESIGCTAFHHLLYDLSRLTFGDELRGSGFSPAGGYALRSLYILLTRQDDLLGGEAYWNNVETLLEETREDIIASALLSAGDILTERLGADTDEWRWGRIHHVVMRANLFDNFGNNFNHGPLAAPGGYATVNVGAPRNPFDGDFTYSHGASMRMIVENTDAGLRSHFQVPGGQRHHRDSPFYNNLLDDYLDNTPFEMPLSQEAAAQNAHQTLVVMPR
ncbi:MAG: penicillin acylase family protein, partial [Bradymonadaceae bacterium]